jgi:hypothetical protein
MAVCISFNYPRTELPGSAPVGGSSSTCGTAGSGSKINVTKGTGPFTPQPFTALRVQPFTGGLTTSTGRPVQYTGETNGYLPADVPHVSQGLAIPGNAGDEGVGYYILFGQTKP